MATHPTVLNKSYLMYTNLTGFQRFFKKFCIIVLWKKVATALEKSILQINIFAIFKHLLRYLENYI